MARQHGNARVTAGRTLIRRYVQALPWQGQAMRPVTATSVPPLSGGSGIHGSTAAHAFTIADSTGAGLCRDSCFRTRSPDQLLATAAPWTSPWLPPGYGQNFWNAALEGTRLHHGDRSMTTALRSTHATGR